MRRFPVWLWIVLGIAGLLFLLVIAVVVFLVVEEMKALRRGEE